MKLAALSLVARFPSRLVKLAGPPNGRLASPRVNGAAFTPFKRQIKDKWDDLSP